MASRLREGWSGFAEMTPFTTNVQQKGSDGDQMKGLTEIFELTSSESLKLFQFLESLFIYVAFSHQEF